MLDLIEELGALEQCLGGDTTPIEAGASGAFLFDAGDFFAELPGANSSSITGGATTDYNEIILGLIGHNNNL
jgi:hypothetical protein